MTKFKTGTIIRVAISTIMLILFVALLSRDYFIDTLEIREQEIRLRSEQESFMGVYFQNQHIGYVRNFFQPKADGIKLKQETFLRLNILGEQHPVHMHGSAELTNTYLLKNFTFRMSAPFYEMEASGEAVGNRIDIRMNTGKGSFSQTITLDEPPFFSTNRRAYLLDTNLTLGKKIKIPYFDPITLAGQNTVVQYKGLEKLLIKGQIENLHHFTESFAGMRINSWLNKQGEVVKEESPAGFVFIAEPKFKATKLIDSGSEILSAVSVPVSGSMNMPNLKETKSIKLRLTLPEDFQGDIDQDRQSMAENVVSITLEELPADDDAICPNKTQHLQSTAYIQADSRQITEITQTMANGSPLAQTRQLSTWVYDNLEKRPVLGIPDALSTLASRKGDCNEHAALFAAMARSAGIPTRVVAGVTYNKNSFYYHAWNEVCINDQWLSVDSTTNQIPTDVGHLKFVVGEIAEQVKIGALLGKLNIEVMGYTLKDEGIRQ